MDHANVPRIAKGFRLQWEPVQQAHVLLYPEGMVKLNPSAGEILVLCDGENSVEDIVSGLEQKFGETNLHADVIQFLSIAQAQRWVEIL